MGLTTISIFLLFIVVNRYLYKRTEWGVKYDPNSINFCFLLSVLINSTNYSLIVKNTATICYSIKCFIHY